MRTFCDSDRLREKQPYPGPLECFDEASGTAWVGRHTNGDPAPWDLYRANWGACGGVVTGDTASGKSHILEGLAYTASSAGQVSVWVGDPDGGISLPGAVAVTHWAATDTSEILQMLRAADTAVSTRFMTNALRHRRLHMITADEPMILLIIDECQRVFEPRSEATALATRIAAQGRKAGVAIIAASTSVALRSFGNEVALRSGLLAGNAAVLSTRDPIHRDLLADQNIIPADELLRLPGVGYLAGRPAPFRAWGLDNARPPVDTARDTPPEPAVANALGDAYAGRAHRRQDNLTTTRRQLAAFQGRT
ncbi:hypothetical protein [Frankia sp. Cas3]|uniref:hypothetical protein n=1 Tax=Frankia sp. Cas3 TaxID=3073926 RepID=UPI002AD1E3C3|nr:hypothetical protein [Frankia sp. Cas3]